MQHTYADKPRLTQIGLAKRLKLNQATVSRCFSAPDKVDQQTRQRVLEAAARLGYRPNAAAQSMRRGRFNAIGILSSDRVGSGPIGGDVIHAMQEDLMAEHIVLTMGRLPIAEITDPDKLPRQVREWSVDALFVNYAVDVPPALEALLGELRMPVLWMNIKRPFNAVRPDDFGGAREATERLIALGHRRVAYMSYDGFSHYSVADRQAGYEAAMRDAGLTPRIETLTHYPENVSSGAPSRTQALIPDARQILMQPNRPTAILAYSVSHMGVAFMEAARSLDIPLPHGLSFVGFGRVPPDYPYRLGVQNIPYGPIGHKAVEMLLGMIKNRERQVPSEAVPMRFRPGDTVNPPLKEGPG